MILDLTDEEAAALLRELDSIIASDRYFPAPRIATLKAIRGNPAGASARAAPAAETLRAAAGRPGTAALKPYCGPPMTLGNAARARVRFIAWCKACQHQVEPDPAEQAERNGAEMPVTEWHGRLVCSQCGSR